MWDDVYEEYALLYKLSGQARGCCVEAITFPQLQSVRVINDISAAGNSRALALLLSIAAG